MSSPSGEEGNDTNQDPQIKCPKRPCGPRKVNPALRPKGGSVVITLG